MADLKGVNRAVASLRAELHSLALPGATISIEVSQAQWHHLRQLFPITTTDAQAPEVYAIKLVSDQVNGDVVIKPRADAEGKVFSTDDLGLAPAAFTLEQAKRELLRAADLFHEQGDHLRALQERVEGLEGLFKHGEVDPELALRTAKQLDAELPKLRARVAGVESVATNTNGYAGQLGADLATLKEKVKALEPLTPWVGPLVNVKGVGETFDRHHDRMDAIDGLIADHLKALEHDEKGISELREKVALLEQRDEAAEAQLVELQRKVRSVLP